MGTRRGNREGNFYQRADGRWEGRVFVAGIGRRSVYGKTRAEAKDKLDRLLDDLEAGLRPPDARLTLGEYLDEWLAVHVKPSVRRRTYESYADTVRLHLRPALGDRPLRKLTPGHVRRMLDDRAKVLGPTSVRYVYSVLRIALGRAVKLGRISRNVCELLDPPTKRSREVRPLTPAQTEQLLTALATSPHECLITTTLATGMRESEVCGLWWEDVDLEGGTLTVRYQLDRGSDRRVAPKTDRSRRVIALPGLATTSLRSHKVRAKEQALAAGRRWSDEDERTFVFAHPDGRPIQGWTAYRRYQDVLRAAGLPGQSFHALRHAFATTLLAEGEELANVSKILGHSDLATTADIYAHLTPQISRRAAERMDAALRRKAT